MSTVEKLQGFVSNVWFQLALGLILLVLGWKMNANSANGVLFISWAILVSCVFRSPWLAEAALIPRCLTAMSCAGVVGLAIYFTLWTRVAPVAQSSSQNAAESGKVAELAEEIRQMRRDFAQSPSVDPSARLSMLEKEQKRLSEKGTQSSRQERAIIAEQGLNLEALKRGERSI